MYWLGTRKDAVAAAENNEGGHDDE